jgi:hypothetical protein
MKLLIQFECLGRIRPNSLASWLNWPVKVRPETYPHGPVEDGDAARAPMAGPRCIAWHVARAPWEHVLAWQVHSWRVAWHSWQWLNSGQTTNRSSPEVHRGTTHSPDSTAWTNLHQKGTSMGGGGTSGVARWSWKLLRWTCSSGLGSAVYRYIEKGKKEPGAVAHYECGSVAARDRFGGRCAAQSVR